MSQKSGLSLSELNRRIDTLNHSMMEKGITSDNGYLALIERKKQQEKCEVMNEVRTLYHQELEKKNVDKSLERILDIIDITVSFIETLIDKVPRLIVVIGSAFKGELKFGLALDLIHEFLGDIFDLLPDKLIGQLIDKQVEYSFKHDKNKVEATKSTTQTNQFEIGPKADEMSSISSQSTQPKKKGKKKIGFFGSR